jgi:hypothetical protein
LAFCIDRGQLHRLAGRVRRRLGIAHALSVKLALANGCSLAAQPGGLFGWVDTGVGTDVLALRTMDAGVCLCLEPCSTPRASPAH